MQYEKAAIAAAVLSIGIKESLYRRTVAIGERSRSSVLVANAWHHRGDALSSIVALCGILGASAGIAILDTCGGILVSGMILKAGLGMGWEAVQELSDASVQRDVINRIRRLATEISVRVVYFQYICTSMIFV